MIQAVDVGADPEIFTFCADPEVTHAPIPPAMFLPHPKKIMTLDRAIGGINRDGYALELNPRPGTPAQVMERIERLLSLASEKLAEHGLVMHDAIKVEIDPNIPAPEDCFMFGCAPDMNAYTKKRTVVTADAPTDLRRFAGGHMVVKLSEKLTGAKVFDLVKVFDLMVGLPAMLASPFKREGRERREQYGKAGCFRYHAEKRLVEYRVPDASWIWNSKVAIYLFEQMIKAVQMYGAGLRISGDTIPQLIDKADETAAYLWSLEGNPDAIRSGN